MKFSDGGWLLPENLTILNPLHAHRVEVRERSVRILASSRAGRGRADELNTMLFTVDLFAPREGVVGVRIAHHLGAPDTPPNFEVTSDPAHVPTIVDTDEAVSLKSGNLTVRVEKAGEWRIDVLRGTKRITSSALRAAGYAVRREDKRAFVFERLDLGVGDTVYGLGERFTPFVKNGQSLDTWNRDGGTGSDQSYKCIPFFVTNRGWGLFVNHPGRVDFEIATERVSKAQFSVDDEILEYMIIDGPTPKEVLERYTALTGRPALPPQWSFGLWLTTSFTTDYDEATVNSFVDGMAERDLPLHVFHFDCYWMRGLNWCDFEWDPAVFPDPVGMLTRLKARGLKICLWINPYIAQQSSLFEEAKQKGYLLKRPDGRVWQWDLWQAGQGIVDFTNPEAAAWYAGHLRRLMAQGVDCFKTDFGERIPTDVVWHDGSDPQRMHNHYTYQYNKLVFDVLREVRGEGEAVLFARSATVGSQKLPVHWGGDCFSDFESMAESLRGGLSLGLSGFGFWSHDIGGFENTAPASVYKRWCAFGLLSSHSRLHGSTSYRVPWLYDEEAVDVLRYFTKLKCRLMPYLFAQAVEATRTGVPVMRAMLLEFPEDPGCEPLDRQYMLGSSLLVAPVFSDDGAVTVYLPEGRWTHLLSGEVVEGHGWRSEQHDTMSLPLYVRENSLIATGARDDRPDYDLAEGVTFTHFAPLDGVPATATVHAGDGTDVLTVTAVRDGSETRWTASDPDREWNVLLRGVHTGALAEGALSIVDTAEGLVVTAKGGLRVTVD